MRALIALFALGLIVTAGVLVGCPPNLQCQSQNDCPIGQNCNAQSKCVAAPPPPPPKDGGFRGGEGEGEGAGEGEGEGGPVVTTAQAQGDISMFVPGDPGQALVGVNTPDDEIITFDLNASTFNTTPVFDFTAKSVAPCGIDTIFTITNTQAATNGSLLDGTKHQETWFSCSTGPHIIIEYENDTGNLFASNTGVTAAELTRIIGPYVHDTSTVTARVIAAKRGGPLQIIPINNTLDQVNNPRAPEAITGVTLSKVESFFVLAEDDPQVGDVLLVFDRGLNKLIPIQRDFNGNSWHGAPLTSANLIVPLSLPANTDAVVLLDDLAKNRSTTAPANTNQLIDMSALSTSGTDQNATNLIVFRPTVAAIGGGTGEIDFFRYETELTAPGTSGFTPLPLGAAGTPAPVKSADRDRTLLQLVPNNADTLVFYALTESPHVWQFRLPHAQNDVLTSQNVQRATLLRLADKPNGMVLVPGVLTGVWLSFASSSGVAIDKELDFVKFGPAF